MDTQSATSQPTGIFGSPAGLYDRIYHDKDYASETQWLKSRLDAAGVTEGCRLLEAACGTGRFLEQLTLYYDVAGFDIDDQTLYVARNRLVDIALWKADMSDFTVEEPYDVVACLFSSIAHIESIDGLHRTARCFFEATRPGGLTVIQPWFTPREYVRGEALMRTYDGPDMKLVRSAVTKVRGNVSHLDFHWMVAQPMLGVTKFVEHQQRTLFSREQMRDALQSAGFSVEYDTEGPSGNGLWIGSRPK